MTPFKLSPVVSGQAGIDLLIKILNIYRYGQLETPEYFAEHIRPFDAGTEADVAGSENGGIHREGDHWNVHGDNFGFNTQGLSQLGNSLILEPGFDPYGLGELNGHDTPININYTNTGLEIGNYTASDFANDPPELPTNGSLREFANEVIDLELALNFFEDEQEREIIYGTNEIDNLSFRNSLISGQPPADGYRMVGGGGNDRLIGSGENDHLEGNSDQDELQGHNGNDILVGDLIDRGPDNIRVVQIVRAMVEAGTAKVILGNHEYNAICFHTPDGNGGYLRPHTEKNINQHKAFLDQYKSLDESDVELNRAIDWFKTLPIFIEEENIRIIHACWDTNSLDTIREQINPDGSMTEQLIFNSAKKSSREYHALEILLKGVEAELPCGLSFSDKDGNKRHEIRLKWWLQGSQSYRVAALVPKDVREQLSDKKLIPKENMISYDKDQPPVFFGHYWMHGEPVLQAGNICCVDYSIAKKGGTLVCYRWNGEQVLSSENFVKVDKIC